MIESVLQFHLNRYPKMQIQDVYKLLHQASLGSEHAVSNPESARRWLVRELAEMGEGISEPLIDPISPDGKIVRVHLRPYVAAGYDLDLLLDAFVRTANNYRGDIQLLEQYWQDAVGMARFSTREMDDFFSALKEKNYPAVHHSAEYGKHFHPAYRVVFLTSCPNIWF
jgi:hypothetical protein